MSTRAARQCSPPKNVSRETITAELYRRTRDLGLFAGLRVPIGDGLRANLAFYEKRIIYAVVEVLPRHVEWSTPNRAARLDLSTLPWRYCFGWSGIEDVLEWAKALRPNTSEEIVWK